MEGDEVREVASDQNTQVCVWPGPEHLESDT